MIGRKMKKVKYRGLARRLGSRGKRACKFTSLLNRKWMDLQALLTMEAKIRPVSKSVDFCAYRPY